MNLKAMYEKRNALIQKMNGIVEAAVNETRAMTESEENEYNSAKAEIEKLDRTIAAAEEERGIRMPKSGKNTEEEQRAMDEERAFRNYIVEKAGGTVEHRAGEQNLGIGENGAIVPVTIASRIIKTVKEISPIFARATHYSEKGTLKVPVWGKANGTHEITVAYSDEFKALTADSGKFTSVDLNGYLFGALTLIGRSLINSATFDIVGFIVSEMAQKFAEFIEKECLVGTDGKMTGALSTTTVEKAKAAAAITADELITLQSRVPSAYQKDAYWTIHPETFALVKKLKDLNGQYILQHDLTSEFPYRLLGKPVALSDNMPKAEASARAVLYGDMSGLSINVRESVSLQLLVEKYADMHAVGLIGWAEMDSKVTDHQKLAVLQMGA